MAHSQDMDKVRVPVALLERAKAIAAEAETVGDLGWTVYDGRSGDQSADVALSARVVVEVALTIGLASIERSMKPKKKKAGGSSSATPRGVTPRVWLGEGWSASQRRDGGWSWEHASGSVRVVDRTARLKRERYRLERWRNGVWAEEATYASQAAVLEAVAESIRRAKLEAVAESSPVEGRETRVYYPSRRGEPESLPAVYAIVPADWLRPSHVAAKGFEPHPGYPPGLQERDYQRDKAEQAKVRTIAQTLHPDILTNTNPDAVNGPPIVTSDGLVLGGNGRTMALQLAYATGRAGEYRERLLADPRCVGVDAAPYLLEAIDRPILVRVLTGEITPERAHLLVRQLNEHLTQAMDPIVEQVARARKLTPAILHTLGLAMGDETDGVPTYNTMRDYLARPASKELVGALERAGVIDRRTRSRYIGPDGLLNLDGRDLVERILVGSLVDSPEPLRDMPPGQRATLAKIVPFVAVLRTAGYTEIGPVMTEVIGLSARMRSMGIDNPDHLNAQGDWLAKPIEVSPEAMALLRLLATSGTIIVTRAFRFMARAARRSPKGQASLFGESATLLEIIERSVKASTENPPVTRCCRWLAA